MQPGSPPPPPSGYGYPPPGYPPSAPPPGYYPPGAMPPGYGMPMRPSGPRTLGVLSIVFGSLAAFGQLIGLATSRGTLMRPEHVPSGAWRHYLDEIGTVSMTFGVLMLAMSIALIVIGTGQRNYKRWAGSASVWWGLAALLILVVQLIVNITVVLPAMDRLFEVLPSHTRAVASAVAKVSLFGSMALYTPYPIILLTAFRRKHIVEAMDQG